MTEIEFLKDLVAEINTGRNKNDLLTIIKQRIKKIEQPDSKALHIADVSNRFSASKMAEWFHNNYEEIAGKEGWQTQDKCRVEFKDLPEKNRTTMIKVCERWLNGC